MIQLDEGVSGSAAWMHYYHYNPKLRNMMEESKSLLKESSGTSPTHTSVSGSAWMFYNHYNPHLLSSLQRLLTGENVESVIDSLVEMGEDEE